MNGKETRRHVDIVTLERRDRTSARRDEISASGSGRRAFVRDMLALAGGVVLGGCGAVP